MKLNVEKINQEIQRLGITKTEIAKQMGISRQLLDYYINRKLRGIRPVEKLARYFHIDPKDLII